MKKSTNHKKETSPAGEEQLITRKEAIKKTGYMALSAATMMMLLSTHASAAGSGTGPSTVTNTSQKNPDGIWDD